MRIRYLNVDFTTKTQETLIYLVKILLVPNSQFFLYLCPLFLGLSSIKTCPQLSSSNSYDLHKITKNIIMSHEKKSIC